MINICKIQINNMKYEVRLIENRVNKKQLQQEKERLLERIAEIDKLLSESE